MKVAINTKVVRIGSEAHKAISEIGSKMKAKTNRPHPTYVVVDMAINALKRELEGQECSL